MVKVERRTFLAGIAMLAAAATSAVANPSRRLASELPPLNLEDNIPRRFGDWHMDQSIAPVLPSPDVQEKLDHLYNTVFSRTYTNPDGMSMMFLIAYGADQADRTTLAHLPEGCYYSQGFDVWPTTTSVVAMPGRNLTIARLRTRKGLRVEPVTYWTTVGDGAFVDELDRRMKRARYALSGIIPDGMLVRVSCIDADEDAAFEAEAAFVAALYAVLKEPTRDRIFGVPA